MKQKPIKKILALDLGTKTGWCFLDKVGQESGAFTYPTYAPWGKHLAALLTLYSPDILVCSQTNNFGYFGPTRKMFMLFGIACMIGERKGIPVIEFADSSARKSVFGSGKLKKKEAHLKFDSLYNPPKGQTEDEKDAIILALGFQLQQYGN